MYKGKFSFPFAEVSWQQVGDAFSILKTQLDGEAAFVVGEFSDFLKDKKMVSRKIEQTWDPSISKILHSAMHSADSWAKVLRAAAGNLNLKAAKQKAGEDFGESEFFEPNPDLAAHGYYLTGAKGSNYWTGVIFSRGPSFSILEGSERDLGYKNLSQLLDRARKCFPSAHVSEDQGVDFRINIPEVFYSWSFTDQVAAVQKQIQAIIDELRQR